MEEESFYVQLSAELEKLAGGLSESKKREILVVLLQKYAHLLLCSAESAIKRNGGTPASIDLDDIKYAANLLGITKINQKTVEKSRDEAIQWLLKRGSNGTWGWWSHLDSPDLRNCIVKIWSTAISLKALLRAGVAKDNPQIVKGVGWLIENRVPDNHACWSLLPRIYNDKRYAHWRHPNTYETSCVLMALQEAENVVSCDKRIIREGIKNLIDHQRKDGYWPIFLASESRAYDDSDVGATSLASTAISRAIETGFASRDARGKVVKSVEWLLSKQREKCGAWGDDPKVPGSTAKTCDAMRAIVESGIDNQQSRKSIKNGIKWLLENQGDREDGRGWGWRKTDEDKKLIASTIENTAFAVNTLLRSGQSHSTVPIQTGLMWLLDHQIEGHWSEHTPRAILALSQYLGATKLQSSE